MFTRPGVIFSPSEQGTIHAEHWAVSSGGDRCTENNPQTAIQGQRASKELRSHALTLPTSSTPTRAQLAAVHEDTASLDPRQSHHRHGSENIRSEQGGFTIQATTAKPEHA